jgi:AbrB family looped-hinge helix DNA binding protein
MASAVINMADNGRLVLPAKIRAELGLHGVEKLVVRTENGKIVLEPHAAAIRRIQDLVAKYVPADVDLVQELIDERRQAARDE